MWPLPLELWPTDKNSAFCTALDSWKCLHIDKENRSELPPWLQFPDKFGEQSSALTQGIPQGWKSKFKCTYSMCWHSWKTGSTCGCGACNSFQAICPPPPSWMSETLREQRGEICRLMKRDSCSSQGPRGLVDLYRRMVCSAWLKVLAGSALKPQNIVYAA